MCAISGLLVPGGQVASVEVLERVSAAMRNRGPDGHATMGFGACALAHERLAIVDLEGGRQPLLSEDGRSAAVVNGEIYNHLELRRELVARGYRFATHSDSEVVLHGYLEYGAGIFARLKGMFAVGLWDGPRQTLVLARDGLGKKPLAYAWLEDGSFLFASDVRAFRAHPAFRPRIRESAVAEVLGYRCVAEPGSIYEGVQKLGAGQWLTLDAEGRRTTGSHWPLPTVAAREAFSAVRLPALAEELRGHVATAVERRLMSDIPVGVLLSGGIDSTLVAYEAARMSPGVQTFTLGFAGVEDERETARITAAALGTRHRELMIELEPRQAIEEAEAAYDEPFSDSSSIASVRICRAAREQVGVVLNGDGGDEAFGGYPRALGLQQLMQPSLGAAARLRLWLQARFAGQPKRRRAKAALRTEALRDLYPSAFERWRSLLWVYSPAEISRMMGQASPAKAAWPELEDDADAERDDYEVYLRNDLLVKMDRASMHCGLEARSPLLDTDVVHFARGLDASWKLREGRGKFLIRAAYADLLPPHIWNLPKRGFSSPMKQWLQGALRADVIELAQDRQQPLYRYLDYAQVQSVTDHLQTKQARVWALLTLNRWLRREGF